MRMSRASAAIQTEFWGEATHCEGRGHCGPFVDRDRFDAVPGWEGMGTCQLCGNTVLVSRHLGVRRALRPMSAR